MIDFYKTYVANNILNKKFFEDSIDNNEVSSTSSEESDFITAIHQSNIPENKNPNYSETNIKSNIDICYPNYMRILELLCTTDTTCKKSYEHIEEFERSLKLW